MKEGRQVIEVGKDKVEQKVAEKLGIPQITYAEEILEVTDKEINVKRRLEKGVEVVKAKFPVLITVNAR